MNLTVCLVGSLMGDGWMKLPGLIGFCRAHVVKVVAGSYCLPVWEWGKKHVVGADYEIVEVIDDPDEPENPYCPGKGHYSMDAGLLFVKSQRPDEAVIGGDEVPTCYNQPTPVLELHEPIQQGDWVAVHPYTRHSWKNINDMLLEIDYPLPVKLLGLPGELKSIKEGWEDCSGLSFDEQVAIVAGCRFFVGVGSSWSNAATLFHKPQIHVSYTDDLAQFTNPKMVKLVTPEFGNLQSHVQAMDAQTRAAT